MANVVTRATRSRRAVARLLPVVLVLALSACAEKHDWETAGIRTTDADRLHPIGAEARREALDLPPGGGVGQAQSENYFVVTRFVRQYLRDGRGPLEIRVSGRDGERTRSFVGAILRENRIAPERVRFAERIDGKSGALLSFSRIAAVAPLSCDDWSEDITRRVEQGVYANFGCASQRNLANMVADPTDIVAPSVADAPTGDRAQATYRAYASPKAAGAAGSGSASQAGGAGAGK